MLNTAVSLGRAGIHVELISEIATDQTGEMIVSFLHDNHVGTDYLNRYPDGKTTIALAFLNERADAAYSFYSDLPKERLTGKLPEPTGNDIVLFGSFFSLTDGIHEKLVAFLAAARLNNALIMYDPNFRKPHLPELPEVLPRILENISAADIIRGSDEDFLHIFALQKPADVYSRIMSRDSQALVYTRSGESVSILTANPAVSIPVPHIEPLSTIGAGDAFNAGLIYGLMKEGIKQEQIPFLSAGEWEKIGGNAIRFSQDVCMSYDNYISDDLLMTLDK
jgi:fructokinase